MASNDETRFRTTYFSCSSCGFWRRLDSSGISAEDYVIPSIREFDATKETPSISHLALELSNRPDEIYKMDPYKFEKFIGSIFQDFFNCEVYHVGRTGDDGIDLYAIVKEEPFLIQVKRRSSRNATEGINVVKLLFASAFTQGANQGAVVTTAKKFSKNAREWTLSPRLEDVGFKIDLIDFPSLMSMVECTAKSGEPPWMAHKAKTRMKSFPDERPWNLTSHEECDVLFCSDGTNATALVYDHESLEDCIVLIGSNDPIDSTVKNYSKEGLAQLCSSNDRVQITVRRNDIDLAREMAIPFRIADDMSTRWIKLYPSRVVDITP